MDDQQSFFLQLGSRGNIPRNSSPPRISGTTLPVVSFAKPLPVATPIGIPNTRWKKRVATTTLDVPVGGRWLDANVAKHFEILQGVVVMQLRFISQKQLYTYS